MTKYEITTIISLNYDEFFLDKSEDSGYTIGGAGTLPVDVLSVYLENVNRRQQKRHPSGQGALSRQKSIWQGYFVVAHLIYHSRDQFANHFSERRIEKREICAFYKYFMKGFW